MTARFDVAVTEFARRVFGMGDPEWLAARPDVVAWLEKGIAYWATVQKADVKKCRYFIRGKLGGLRLVYYGMGARQYARNYVVPRDPGTVRQQERRALMRAVSRAWGRVLTAEQHGAWNAAARQVLSRRPPQGPLSGQELFVKLNSVLALAGRELLLWPAAPVAFGPNPVAAVMVRWEGQRNRKKAESRRG